MEPLVTTQWLEHALGSSDLRILDATYFLPEHGRDAAAEYAAGHIPGAAFADLAALADRETSLPSMLPPAAQFAARMETLGIGRDDRIVVYDDSPVHSAARLWWMLRLYGATRVAMLDGGMTKWAAEGRAVDTTLPAPAAARFSASLDPSDVRTLDDVRATSAQLVDARSPTRFAGAEPEARPGVVPGHIPGARNLHYARLFQADGTWKQAADLRAAFADAGIDIERPIVTTCGSGITAAVLVFALHLLGKRAALYDGSWTEWGSHPETPKATGAA